MNKVSGTNFLHQLTLAQKQVFPENSSFSISAVTTSRIPSPSSQPSHPPLSPSKSVPLAKSQLPPQLPSPYGKNKIKGELRHQSSEGVAAPIGRNLDDPPPVPQQNFKAVSVVMREKPRDSAPSSLNIAVKSRRRHSSINYSEEFEREQEREREKLEHVTVGGAMYAVVSKPNKGKPRLPERGDSEKEIRRIQPKTPSPSAQRRGYIQLEFQNGTSNLCTAQGGSNPTPLPRRGIPPDSRTKWSYSTVVFEAEGRKEKEREFENDGATVKKNKPLPPPPRSKISVSDSNLAAPQPVPRQKKPNSLVDVKKQTSQPRGELEYAALEFTHTHGPMKQNGSAGGAARRRELPKLPPKQESLQSPSQAQSRPL